MLKNQNQNQLLLSVQESIPKSCHLFETLQIAVILSEQAANDNEIKRLLFSFLADQLLLNRLLPEQ